jgi:hypothetical protein
MLWKSVKEANGAPKHPILATGTANGEAMYQNTTPSAFVSGLVTGVHGANSADTVVAGEAHKGWNLKKYGTGPVATLAINAGGTSYNNTDVITISGGTTNGTATLTTNSTGGLATVTLTALGAGFTNTAATTVAVANSTGGATGGSGATFVTTFGGRAGRVMSETLVAMGNMLDP